MVTESRGARFCPPLRILSFWILGAVLAGLLFVVDRIEPAGRTVLRVGGMTDRSAYFAVAHSLLFDRDFDLSNQYAALGVVPNNHGRLWWYFEVQPETGLPGTPFPIGFSLLVAPFILTGAILEGVLHGRWDGYAGLPVVGFFLGNLFYTCAGMTLLFLLLRALGTETGADKERAKRTAWIVTMGMWPTTSLAYYSLAPMSHIAGFAAAAAFLLAWWRARDGESWRRWLVTGACGGLLFLCRWQMALFALIPLLYDLARLRSGQVRLHGSEGRAWLASRLAGLGGALLASVPQIAQWKAIHGRFVSVPQGEAFFEFPPRHALNVLLSTNHGWFVWTPITLVGVAGILLASRRQPRLFAPLAIALAVQVALVGSLPSNWMAAESFSNRMLTECLPIVGLGLVVLLLEGSKRTRRAMYAFGVLCTVWSLLFAVQYRLDAVPKADRLTTQELFTDKMLLQRTMKRRAASLEARRLLDESPARALAAATAAAERFGHDRLLLKAIAEAHRRRGDLEAAAQAERRLVALLDERLF